MSNSFYKEFMHLLPNSYFDYHLCIKGVITPLHSALLRLLERRYNAFKLFFSKQFDTKLIGFRRNVRT